MKPLALRLVVASLLLATAPASADEIRVMTSGALTAAYLELIPQFELASAHKLVTAATSMGTGAESIPSRLQRGESVDVVIVADAALDDLIREGTVVAGSRVDLARSGIGMAVRAGAPRPDISSVDALKRTLLDAKSIAYSASVSGVYLSTELFQRLGIAGQIMGKSRRIDRERVGAVVARGEAEIGFQQISELLAVPGIDYVGPLPPAVQRVTVFSAGIGVSAKAPDAARAFIRFLASAAAVPAITRSGLEPMASPGSAAGPHNADEEMIREARARSNRAIAAHNIEAIAGVWMEDVHVVSSTSDQTAGRDLNRQRFTRQFANRPDTTYLRQPTAITVYAPWAVASERGEWTGRWTEPDGALEIGGTYLAQWRKVDGQWLIQAELYVPLRCNGRRYCAQRP